MHWIPSVLSSVSIHAPTKGATKRKESRDGETDSFNPRSHEGSDCNTQVNYARGVCFNPRSHEGSDLLLSMRSDPSLSFNPRSHEGSDRHHHSRLHVRHSFNPRSHEGSDHAAYESDGYSDGVSIHAPTKGATAMHWIPSVLSSVSIHAPTKGATKRKESRDGETDSFNPRSHEGSDCNTQVNYARGVCFNPRSHEGSDGCVINGQRHLRVSIHAPTKGATSDLCG